MILVILTTEVLLRKNLDKSTWRLNSSEFTHFCIYDLKTYLQFHSTSKSPVGAYQKLLKSMCSQITLEKGKTFQGNGLFFE